jgi:hypothetical protein
MITSPLPETTLIESTATNKRVCKTCDRYRLMKTKVRPVRVLKLVEADLISMLDHVHVNSAKQKTQYVPPLTTSIWVIASFQKGEAHSGIYSAC